MADFKVGDRVQLVDNTVYDWVPKGSTGVVQRLGPPIGRHTLLYVQWADPNIPREALWAKRFVIVENLSPLEVSVRAYINQELRGF